MISSAKTVLLKYILLAALFPATGLSFQTPKLDPQTECAKVDDQIIRYVDIERERKKQLQVKQIGEAQRAIIDAKIREQLIERTLAMAALDRTGKAASRDDVEFEISRWKQELSTQGSSLSDYLAQEGIKESDLRREIRWRVSWNRYLAAYLTDKNLEKFFTDHQSDYDGRKLRVAQILLKAPAASSAEVRSKLHEKLDDLRQAIVSDKISFAEAAKKHSEAPSASEGGVQGWIERYEPMGEAFSKAAFALKAGETSSPFVTSFGVHLVHCLEIEPGKKTWRDVRTELERNASAYLGHWLADSQREHSHVTRSEALPLLEDKDSPTVQKESAPK